MQKAFVIHSRRYTDSRLLVDFFTENDGLVRALARDPGKKDRSKYEPFQLVEVALGASGDGLKMLKYCEPAKAPVRMMGLSLFSAIYVNELCYRLLPPALEFTSLFHFYEKTLFNLSNAVEQKEIEIALREMDFYLLEQLGFGLEFGCTQMGEKIVESEFYAYSADMGFYRSKSSPPKIDLNMIPGHCLIAISSGDWEDASTLLYAKKISRAAFAPLLGKKPLKSSELFR